MFQTLVLPSLLLWMSSIETQSEAMVLVAVSLGLPGVMDGRKLFTVFTLVSVFITIEQTWLCPHCPSCTPRPSIVPMYSQFLVLKGTKKNMAPAITSVSSSRRSLAASGDMPNMRR